MEKLFTTCLLVQEGSSAPELIQSDVNLHPGSGFSPDQGNTVLLAGGFPSLSPEAGLPLSSTLFLNSSLAKCSPDDLQRIGVAELQRKNSIDYRSFTLEADNRVAVVCDDADKLLAFLDSYGGTLDTEPLLVKGCHPDLPTVSELEFTAGENTCRLDYQVRSPIDHDRCSYCGNCGPACPEGCIDEKLFLDYNKCTLCRECEPVCPTGAIDVHGVLQHSVEVPGIIILGDVKVEVEGGERFLFREQELDRYFATLFPVRVDEVVTWDRSLCQYSSRIGYGCDLCISSCRYGAIVQDSKGVHVDAFKCEECGGCFAACPTGALQYQKFTDNSFASYLDGFPELSGRSIVIGSDEDFHRLWWRGRDVEFPNTYFIGYDQPQGLSLYHFLALATQGVQNIIVLGDEQNPGSNRQMSQANDFLAKLFDVESLICHMSVAELVAQGLPIVAAKAPPVCSREGGDAGFSDRRHSIAANLEELVNASGRTVAIQPRGYIPFATVSCDSEKCTQCAACLNDCRIGALSANPDELTLNSNGSLCVGCGVCVKICPENALAISSAFSLEPQFFQPVELARAEPMSCKRCGKVFGTKKSYERVMSILASKETVDVSHFEYCDTCRVVKLFEEQ